MAFVSFPNALSDRLSQMSNVKCHMFLYYLFLLTLKMKDAKSKLICGKYPNYDFIVLIASRIATEKNFSLVMRIASGYS